MRAGNALLIGFTLAVVALARADPAALPTIKSGTGPPPAAAPREIWDVWLHFHEEELCQGLDTYFVFQDSAVEIWCRIDDEKSFQKFTDLIAPLRGRFQVTVYPTRPTVEKKSSDDKEPPPSLWTNVELRGYLHDPFLRFDNVPDPEIPRPPPRRGSDPEYMFKQRIIMFADQTLEFASKMRRFADDLPALAGAAYGPGMPAAFHARARAVCLAHALAVDRYAEKLAGNLSQALPRGGRKSPEGTEEKKPEAAASTPREAALRIAGTAASFARRAYHFIYPIHHTVAVSDLRESSLLESAKEIHRLVSDFQHSLGN